MNIDTKAHSLVELKIPRRPEYLRVVRLLVSGYVSRFPAPVDMVEDIKVAVSEACNCSMRDTDPACAEGRLDISCFVEDDKLCFEIRDENATSAPDSSSDEASLGLLLIRTLMEDVEVRSEQNSGVVISMKKTITSI